MVEFAVESTRGFAMGRVGSIRNWKSFGGEKHSTPSFLLYTRAGHIPHLAWNLAEKHLHFAQQPILQLTLPSMYDFLRRLEEGGEKNHFRIPERYAKHLSFLDPLGQRDSGYNNNSSVAIWVKKCRINISTGNLMKVMEKITVNSFSTIFDYDTPKNSQNKRLTKSVIRSVDYSGGICTSVEPLAFTSIGGGLSSHHRLRFVKEFLSKGADKAFSIDLSLFSSNPNLEEREPFDELEIKSLLTDLMAVLPVNSVKLVEGAFSPPRIVFLANLGVDLFDSSYAILLAEEGKALRMGDEFPIDPSDFSEISFDDKRYVDDFFPLVDGCHCYACANYTKAYLQHLRNTKEILAGILLVIHNLMEFDRMFVKIRDCFST